MDDVVSFHDLVETFSGVVLRPSTLLPDLKAASECRVFLKHAEPDFFVPPELTVHKGGSPNPTFWLISAPAAVGKSVLAQALAYNITRHGRQVLYVPLRGARIGENFFTGLMGSVFPHSAKAQVMDSIREGRTIVIFDGYDELSMNEEQSRMAQLFIGQVSTELVQETPRRGHRGPSVIFLYRSAIKRLGIFNTILKYSNQLDLQYFSPEKQVDFLASYVTKRRPGYIISACGQFLNELKEGLPQADDETTQTFFGHAPVLMALGDLILEEDSSNLWKIVQDLVKGKLDAKRWGFELVSRIIQHLLEREVSKFPDDMLSTNGITSFEPYPVEFQNGLLNQILVGRIGKRSWEHTISEYAIDECERRLTANASYRKLSPSDRKVLQERYIDEVIQKFKAHPFITDRGQDICFTNPVYEEKYLAAYLLKCKESDLPRIFLAYQTPSYYLAEFVMDGLPGRDLNGRQRLIFYILRSLSMASRDLFEARITRVPDRWQINVETGKVAIEPFWYRDAILLIDVPDGQILESLIVEGGEGSIVGLNVLEGDDHKRRITLSEVSLDAPDVELAATHVTCNAVRISADTLRLDDALESIEGIHSLSISGKMECSTYIRKKYGNDLQILDSADHVTFLRKKLNQTLVWFRKHGADEYGVYHARFKTVVLNKGRDRDAIIVAEFLRQQGILQDRDRMVVLNQDKLAAFDVYYVKQNELNFGRRFHEMAKRWAAYTSPER